MTTTLGRSRNRNFPKLISAALFGAALLVAAGAPAIAKDNGHHGNNGRGHGNQGNHGNPGNHGNQGRQVRPAQYRVPSVITVEHRGDFRPYFTGRTYYAPHHHYHAAYRFPVWVNGAVAYRPYAYCDDHLFVTGSVMLPRLAIAFNFGQPGVMVGGYYGSGYYAAPPPPAYYVYEEPRRYRCDRDHDHDRYDDRDWDDD